MNNKKDPNKQIRSLTEDVNNLYQKKTSKQQSIDEAMMVLNEMKSPDMPPSDIEIPDWLEWTDGIGFVDEDGNVWVWTPNGWHNKSNRGLSQQRGMDQLDLYQRGHIDSEGNPTYRDYGNPTN